VFLRGTVAAPKEGLLVVASDMYSQKDPNSLHSTGPMLCFIGARLRGTIASEESFRFTREAKQYCRRHVEQYASHRVTSLARRVGAMRHRISQVATGGRRRARHPLTPHRTSKCRNQTEVGNSKESLYERSASYFLTRSSGRNRCCNHPADGRRSIYVPSACRRHGFHGSE